MLILQQNIAFNNTNYITCNTTFCENKQEKLGKLQSYYEAFAVK